MILPPYVHPTTRRVYEEIEKSYSLTGRAPGIRALRKLCGLKSTATIEHHIQRLVMLGWIKKHPERIMGLFRFANRVSITYVKMRPKLIRHKGG